MLAGERYSGTHKFREAVVLVRQDSASAGYRRLYPAPGPYVLAGDLIRELPVLPKVEGKTDRPNRVGATGSSRTARAHHTP